MKKVTKKEIKEFVKYRLANNNRWALQALVRIFENQTDAEQIHEDTHDLNGIGFTGVDGKILSSFANQYIKRGFLSVKQMNILFKKMPKYWEQIIKSSDIEKLELMVIKNRNQ